MGRKPLTSAGSCTASRLSAIASSLPSTENRREIGSFREGARKFPRGYYQAE